jgi:hypothetical protein
LLCVVEERLNNLLDRNGGISKRKVRNHHYPFIFL